MKINEVSSAYDMSADTLRYYERIGLLPRVTRLANGIREYGETDTNWVHFIKCMRGAGVSIETLIEYVSLFQEGDATVQTRKALLIDERDKLAQRVQEMSDTLARLNAKIEGYDTHLLPNEKKLIKKSSW